MPNCPSLSVCPFFNDKMIEKPNLTKMYKSNYCKGDNSNCARWVIASTIGKEFVPSNLYPNMIDQAEKIIETFKIQK